jgi:hypothetical protein
VKAAATQDSSMEPLVSQSPAARRADAAPSRLLVGLIGAGIQRSLTPAMHEAEATAHGLRLHYQLIDLDRTGATVELLPTLITAARAMGFAGLNITYPCKQAVIPLLDELSEEARAMGAVNTVVCHDGRLGLERGLSARAAAGRPRPRSAARCGWRRRGDCARRPAPGRRAPGRQRPRGRACRRPGRKPE